MTRVGLKAVSLDQETIKRLKREGIDIFRQVRECEWNMVLASPERLTAPAFDHIVRNDFFRSNVVLYVVDEAHVLRPWSLTFRKAYDDIPQLRLRLPISVPILGLTATLLPGSTERDLLHRLRFRPGYHITRRSCEQPNLRLAFQTLTHGLNGTEFPDFAWVAEGKHKVILYCKTIDLGFRLASYLWRLLPPGPSRFHKIRLYNSLLWPQSNEDTVKAIDEDPSVIGVVATVKFGMGIDVRKVSISASVGLPDSVELGGQERGRAGRDRSQPALGICYVEKTIVASITKEIEDGKLVEPLSDSEIETLRGTRASRVRSKRPALMQAQDDTHLGKKKSQRLVDAGHRRLIAAHIKHTCLVAESNSIFGNTHATAHLTCLQARRRLPCSSCLDVSPHPHSARQSKAQTVTTQPVQDDGSLDYAEPPSMPPPKHSPLTKEMKSMASSRLDDFALSRWKLKDGEYFRSVPHHCYLPSTMRRDLLENLHMIRDRETLAGILIDWDFIDSDLNPLFQEIQSLNVKFDELHRTKPPKRQKKAATNQTRKRARLE